MTAVEDSPSVERDYDPDGLIGLLGRGSTAGSKLYRLYYGKPPGADVGNEYSKRNLERLRSSKPASEEKVPEAQVPGMSTAQRLKCAFRRPLSKLTEGGAVF